MCIWRPSDLTSLTAGVPSRSSHLLGGRTAAQGALEAIRPALGLLTMLQASTTVHDEFDAVCHAFDEIKCRIVLIDTVIDIHALVREASVELLAQVLAIFGLISKMRKAGRFRRFCDPLRGERLTSWSRRVATGSPKREADVAGFGTPGEARDASTREGCGCNAGSRHRTSHKPSLCVESSDIGTSC